MDTVVKTLKVRVKDKHKLILERMAFEVNQVWNAANEVTADHSYAPIPGVGYIRIKWTAYDLQKLLKAIKQERGFIIHSTTVQEVMAAHHKARKQFKTDTLRWRISGGPRRSLGWIPFKSGAAKWKNGQVYFAGYLFKAWDRYGLSAFGFKSGAFSQDARGRWYFNIVVEAPVKPSLATGQIGIDLGLKDVATCSNGLKLENKRIYRNQEEKLGKAQRANKTARVRSLHAKIRNKRLDAIHKLTTRLVRENAFIVVGHVSSSSLVKTKIAKSVVRCGLVYTENAA